MVVPYVRALVCASRLRRSDSYPTAANLLRFTCRMCRAEAQGCAETTGETGPKGAEREPGALRQAQDRLVEARLTLAMGAALRGRACAARHTQRGFFFSHDGQGTRAIIVA
jgi:hypothetical protein